MSIYFYIYQPIYIGINQYPSSLFHSRPFGFCQLSYSCLRPPLEQPDITLVKPSVRRGPSPAMVARLGPRQPQGLEASRLAPLPSVQVII